MTFLRFCWSSRTDTVALLMSYILSDNAWWVKYAAWRSGNDIGPPRGRPLQCC
jgi:hypothetical protein